MGSIHFKLFCSLACLVFVGCAGSGRKITRTSPEYLYAVQIFGSSTNLFFSTVPSQGIVNDSLVSGLSAVSPSFFSRQLAEVIALAEARPVDLAVTGDSALKTRVSLVSALEIHDGKKLPRLRVLYIGAPSHQAAIENAVSRIGGEFFFADRDKLLSHTRNE